MVIKVHPDTRVTKWYRTAAPDQDAERGDEYMHCPKCQAMMRTVNRSGVQIEQCDACRGIFLDYGELESLSRLEILPSAPPGYPATPPPAYPATPPAAYPATPPPGYPPPGYPAWGATPPPHSYHGGHRKQRGLGKMLFSS
jgi:hypothetical protein